MSPLSQVAAEAARAASPALDAFDLLVSTHRPAAVSLTWSEYATLMLALRAAGGASLYTKPDAGQRARGYTGPAVTSSGEVVQHDGPHMGLWMGVVLVTRET